MTPNPRSGIEDGSWAPAFPSQRPPFVAGQPGPALRHGSYSTLVVGARAAELAGEIRETLPLYSAADEPVLRLLATTLSRIERASAALDEVDDHLGDRRLAEYLASGADGLDRLRRDLRAWIGLAARLAAELGLTPSSRARLGLDLALAQRASDEALQRLADEGRAIRERREAV